MTWPDFLEHFVASTLLTGNGLAVIVRSGNGQLAGFRYVPWGMVTVAELSSGRLAYDVSDGRGNTRRFWDTVRAGWRIRRMPGRRAYGTPTVSSRCGAGTHG